MLDYFLEIMHQKATACAFRITRADAAIRAEAALAKMHYRDLALTMTSCRLA